MTSKNLVEENSIFLNQDLDNFEDVVQLIGNQFLQNGAVKETYTQAVIEREKIFPTGLPADGYNIAIPHTDCDHVNYPSVGIITTNKPIEVSMMGSPEVKLNCQIFFPLAMEHPKKQLDLLKRLMKFFQKRDNLEAIHDAVSKEEVLEVVQKLDFFNE